MEPALLRAQGSREGEGHDRGSLIAHKVGPLVNFMPEQRALDAQSWRSKGKGRHSCSHCPIDTLL